MSKLTLDEAIKHCLEVAEENDLAAETYEILAENNHNAYERLTAETNSSRCKECAADHRQLAEWLTELKELKNSIGAVKLSNMKEALALIRTLKAELNGWRQDPFDIIAEVCGAVTDCRRCQWYEKCPLSKNCGSWRRDR